MTDELQLAYEFFIRRRITAEELDEQYSSIANHIEAIDSRICFQMRDSLSVVQITAGAGGY
jgi:peptide chain release factor 2